ncbi:MAG: hypothetical protein J7L15_06610 [Clostridiales bacterium]|nr:hypothetical protein [Clostridiales bacterium]
MNKPYMPIKQAIDIIKNNDIKTKDLIFPYKVPIREEDGKIKKVREISLKVLLKAITLKDLDHPLTEEKLKTLDESNIVSCYIFGSVINPRYKIVRRKYFFGLFEKETEEIDACNDIDIAVFLRNCCKTKNVKTISSWEMTFSDGYGSTTKKRFADLEISFFPYTLTLQAMDPNDFVRQHIADKGICLMGDNVMNTQKYAIWSHDVVKKSVTCVIPRNNNIVDERQEKEEKQEVSRFDIMDI